VVFDENLCKIAQQYLKKGSKIFLRGSLQTRKWTDQSGTEKYSTEVVLQRFRGELTMLDGRGEQSSYDPSRPGTGSMTPKPDGARPYNDLDSEIPF
jgi:single-strand DNA-binding protein